MPKNILHSLQMCSLLHNSKYLNFLFNQIKLFLTTKRIKQLQPIDLIKSKIKIQNKILIQLTRPDNPTDVSKFVLKVTICFYFGWCFELLIRAYMRFLTCQIIFNDSFP